MQKTSYLFAGRKKYKSKPKPNQTKKPYTLLYRNGINLTFSPNIIILIKNLKVVVFFKKKIQKYTSV